MHSRHIAATRTKHKCISALHPSQNTSITCQKPKTGFGQVPATSAHPG